MCGNSGNPAAFLMSFCFGNGNSRAAHPGSVSRLMRSSEVVRTCYVLSQLRLGAFCLYFNVFMVLYAVKLVFVYIYCVLSVCDRVYRHNIFIVFCDSGTENLWTQYFHCVLPVRDQMSFRRRLFLAQGE